MRRESIFTAKIRRGQRRNPLRSSDGRSTIEASEEYCRISDKDRATRRLATARWARNRRGHRRGSATRLPPPSCPFILSVVSYWGRHLERDPSKNGTGVAGFGCGFHQGSNLERGPDDCAMSKGREREMKRYFRLLAAAGGMLIAGSTSSGSRGLSAVGMLTLPLGDGSIDLGAGPE